MTDAYVDEGLRRDGHQELPLGPRARQTRATILKAAADAFGANGYASTTMADVATASGVSLGTVYQYFRDRADLISVLVRGRVAKRMNQAEVGWKTQDGVAGLERLLTNFVAAYAEVAPLAAVWEEVVHVEPALADLRRRLGRQLTDAVARELGRAAKAGAVRSNLDPDITARALTAMVDRFCFVTYVFDPPEAGPPAPSTAARELATLWADAIGLRN
ncbi:MAG: TetR/AcrR family transcriptional regulator [Actinobacteria bacterium]|nr:TetR/AcrR family transcriptional regulator [Actinomycetota bacterium]